MLSVASTGLSIFEKSEARHCASAGPKNNPSYQLFTNSDENKRNKRERENEDERVV